MKDKAVSIDRDEKEGIADNSLVSIITPVLNGSKYLEACIQSVLNQKYTCIEHVFIDGGSIDGTLGMLSNYRAKYPNRIRYISESDKGAGDAWNKGLRMARGEIFGWLGSDDMLYGPDVIQIVVKFFRLNPDAYFVFGACNYINEKGEIISTSKTKEFDLDELINDRNRIPATSAFYRRVVVDKVGWFDTYGNDYDYWIRVAKVFQIHRIEKVLSNFRVHRESETGCKRTHKRALREDFLVSRRHGGRFFSGYCKRYYIFLMIELFRPILGSIYPFMNRMLRRK